ncbi:MAG: hypothetical protein NT145_05905 [Elusimicrobia bacterium]|nr:hypothetical protein [Elusimicrobiota bacterium]
MNRIYGLTGTDVFTANTGDGAAANAITKNQGVVLFGFLYDKDGVHLVTRPTEATLQEDVKWVDSFLAVIRTDGTLRTALNRIYALTGLDAFTSTTGDGTVAITKNQGVVLFGFLYDKDGVHLVTRPTEATLQEDVKWVDSFLSVIRTDGTLRTALNNIYGLIGADVFTANTGDGTVAITKNQGVVLFGFLYDKDGVHLATRPAAATLQADVIWVDGFLTTIRGNTTLQTALNNIYGLTGSDAFTSTTGDGTTTITKNQGVVLFGFLYDRLGAHLATRPTVATLRDDIIWVDGFLTYMRVPANAAIFAALNNIYGLTGANAFTANTGDGQPANKITTTQGVLLFSFLYDINGNRLVAIPSNTTLSDNLIAVSNLLTQLRATLGAVDAFNDLFGTSILATGALTADANGYYPDMAILIGMLYLNPTTYWNGLSISQRTALVGATDKNGVAIDGTTIYSDLTVAQQAIIVNAARSNAYSDPATFAGDIVAVSNLVTQLRTVTGARDAFNSLFGTTIPASGILTQDVNGYFTDMAILMGLLYNADGTHSNAFDNPEAFANDTLQVYTLATSLFTDYSTDAASSLIAWLNANLCDSLGNPLNLATDLAGLVQQIANQNQQTIYFLYSLLYKKDGTHSNNWNNPGAIEAIDNISLGNITSILGGLSALRNFVQIARTTEYSAGFFGQISGADIMNIVYGIDISGRISREALKGIYDKAYGPDGSPTVMLTDPRAWFRMQIVAFNLGDFIRIATNQNIIFYLVLPIIVLYGIAKGISSSLAKKKKKRMAAGKRPEMLAKLLPKKPITLADIESKLSVFVALNAMPALDPNITPEERERRTRDQLALFFSPDEVNYLIPLVEAKKVILENPFKKAEGYNPEDRGEAPPVNGFEKMKKRVNGFAKTLNNLAVDASGYITEDALKNLEERFGKEYGNTDYQVIIYIIKNKLLTREILMAKLKEAVKVHNRAADFNGDIFTNAPDLQNGIVFSEFKTKAINYIEKDLLERLRTMDTANEAQRNAFKNYLNLCPPTSETLFLKRVIQEKIFDDNDERNLNIIQVFAQNCINDAARDNSLMNFQLFINKLLEKKILEPIFENVSSALPDEMILAVDYKGDSLAETARKAAIDDVLPTIIRNPYMLSKVGNKVKVDLYPVDRTMAVETFEEKVLEKFLVQPIIYAQQHSFGQLTCVPELVTYTAKMIAKKVEAFAAAPLAGKPAIRTDIDSRIKNITNIFVGLVKQQIPAAKFITERPEYAEAAAELKKKLIETDVSFLFEALMKLMKQGTVRIGNAEVDVSNLDLFNLPQNLAEAFFPNLKNILLNIIPLAAPRFYADHYNLVAALNGAIADKPIDVVAKALKEDTVGLMKYVLTKAEYEEFKRLEKVGVSKVVKHIKAYKVIRNLLGIVFAVTAFIGVLSFLGVIISIPIIALAFTSTISFIGFLCMTIVSKFGTVTRELFWKRIFKPLLGFKFWGIEKLSTKAATVFLAAVFIFVGMLFFAPVVPLLSFMSMPFFASIAASGFSSFFGMTLLTMSAVLPKFIMGKAQKTMKGFFVSIGTMFSIYFGGFLGGFFVSGLPSALSAAAMSIFGAFFSPITIVVSAIVLVLIALPTFTSFWHIFMAKKAMSALGEGTYSKTFKKSLSRVKVQLAGGILMVVGLVSLISLIFIPGIAAVVIAAGGIWTVIAVVLGALFVLVSGLVAIAKPKMKTAGKTTAKVILGISGIVFLVGLVGFAALALLSGALITVLAYTVITALLVFAAGGLIFLRGSAMFGEKTSEMGFLKYHTAVYKEVRGLENKYGPVLPTGETLKEKLKRDVNQARRIRLLTEKEAKSWLDYLDGIGGGFVRPENPIARKKMAEIFKSVIQKKPLVDDFSSLGNMTSHIMAANDEFSKKWEIITQKGSFNNNTVFLGVVAKMYSSSWNTLLDDIRLKLNEAMSDPKTELTAVERQKMEKFINDLSKMDEREMPKIPEFITVNGNKFYSEVVVAEIEKLVNDVTPSNSAAVENLQWNRNEEHLYMASQFSDNQYFNALQTIMQDYATLTEAYAALYPKRAVLSGDQKIFVENYLKYEEIAKRKDRLIFQECRFWNGDGNLGIDINLIPGANFGKLKSVDPIENLTDYMQLPPKKTGLLSKPNIPDFIKNNDVFKKAVYTTWTPDEWAKKFNEFRAVNDQKIREYLASVPDNEKIGATSIWETWKNICRVADILTTTKKYDVDNFYVPREEDIIKRSKNPGIAQVMFEGAGVVRSQDGQVKVSLGHNIWSLNFVTLYDNVPNLAATNHPMEIWGSELTEAGEIYAGSQETWTSLIQKALTLMTSFYGKGGARPSMFKFSLTPIEDSAAALEHKAKGFVTMQVGWMDMDWGRSTLWAESIASTELRYAYNVTRAIMDIAIYRMFMDPKVGYDQKVANLMLFNHYIMAPLMVFNTILLPFLILFSSFAFLVPFFTAITIVGLLMEAISLSTFVRYSAETGSAWQGLKIMLREMYRGFFAWVGNIPLHWQGVKNAVLDRFSYIRSDKAPWAEKYSVKERYQNGMNVTSKYGVKGLLFFGLYMISVFLLAVYSNALPLIFIPMSFIPGLNIIAIFLIGMSAGWSIAFNIGMGLVVAIPYFLSLIAWTNGFNSFRVFLQKNGTIKTRSFSENLKWSLLMFLLAPIISVVSLVQRYFWYGGFGKKPVPEVPDLRPGQSAFWYVFKRAYLSAMSVGIANSMSAKKVFDNYKRLNLTVRDSIGICSQKYIGSYGAKKAEILAVINDLAGINDDEKGINYGNALVNFDEQGVLSSLRFEKGGQTKNLSSFTLKGSARFWRNPITNVNARIDLAGNIIILNESGAVVDFSDPAMEVALAVIDTAAKARAAFNEIGGYITAPPARRNDADDLDALKKADEVLSKVIETYRASGWDIVAAERAQNSVQARILAGRVRADDDAALLAAVNYLKAVSDELNTIEVKIDRNGNVAINVFQSLVILFGAVYAASAKPDIPGKIQDALDVFLAKIDGNYTPSSIVTACLAALEYRDSLARPANNDLITAIDTAINELIKKLKGEALEYVKMHINTRYFVKQYNTDARLIAYLAATPGLIDPSTGAAFANAAAFRANATAEQRQAFDEIMTILNSLPQSLLSSENERGTIFALALPLISANDKKNELFNKLNELPLFRSVQRAVNLLVENGFTVLDAFKLALSAVPNAKKPDVYYMFANKIIKSKNFAEFTKFYKIAIAIIDPSTNAKLVASYLAANPGLIDPSTGAAFANAAAFRDHATADQKQAFEETVKILEIRTSINKKLVKMFSEIKQDKKGEKHLTDEVINILGIAASYVTTETDNGRKSKIQKAVKDALKNRSDRDKVIDGFYEDEIRTIFEDANYAGGYVEAGTNIDNTKQKIDNYGFELTAVGHPTLARVMSVAPKYALSLGNPDHRKGIARAIINNINQNNLMAVDVESLLNLIKSVNPADVTALLELFADKIIALLANNDAINNGSDFLIKSASALIALAVKRDALLEAVGSGYFVDPVDKDKYLVSIKSLKEEVLKENLVQAILVKSFERVKGAAPAWNDVHAKRAISQAKIILEKIYPKNETAVNRSLGKSIWEQVKGILMALIPDVAQVRALLGAVDENDRNNVAMEFGNSFMVSWNGHFVDPGANQAFFNGKIQDLNAYFDSIFPADAAGSENKHQSLGQVLAYGYNMLAGSADKQQLLLNAFIGIAATDALKTNILTGFVTGLLYTFRGNSLWTEESFSSALIFFENIINSIPAGDPLIDLFYNSISSVIKNIFDSRAIKAEKIQIANAVTNPTGPITLKTKILGQIKDADSVKAVITGNTPFGMFWAASSAVKKGVSFKRLFAEITQNMYGMYAGKRFRAGIGAFGAAVSALDFGLSATVWTEEFTVSSRKTIRMFPMYQAT